VGPARRTYDLDDRGPNLDWSFTAAESTPAFVALGIIVGVTSVPYILLLLARVAVPSPELFTADGSLPWFL
jgi:hypothetical protein